MNNDLISRAAAINAVNAYDYRGISLRDVRTVTDGCADEIRRLPAIDAVPVVRCKNCRHFNMRSMECENDAVSTDHEGGASYSLNFYLDDFCSFGERKMDLEGEK